MKIEKHGNVAVVHSEDVLITDEQSALDLWATVSHDTGCENIAVYKAALPEDFFDLSTGIAGGVLQKFINYHVRFAVIGDFSGYTSKALRDFIYESNKAGNICFVSTKAEAVYRLSNQPLNKD